MILAPTELTVENEPAPMELIAFTFTRTRVSRDRVNGAVISTLIGIVQAKLVMIVADAPLQLLVSALYTLPESYK